MTGLRLMMRVPLLFELGDVTMLMDIRFSVGLLPLGGSTAFASSLGSVYTYLLTRHGW